MFHSSEETGIREDEIDEESTQMAKTTTAISVSDSKAALLPQHGDSLASVNTHSISVGM